MLSADDVAAGAAWVTLSVSPMYFKVCSRFENIFVFGSGKHFDAPPLLNFPACERLSSRILNLNSRCLVAEQRWETEMFVATAVAVSAELRKQRAPLSELCSSCRCFRTQSEGGRSPEDAVL